MAAYVMVGFDSAGELAEETHSPRKTTPKTIIRALTTSGLGGGLLILGARMTYSMAREGALPFSKALGKVSPRTGTPVVTSIVVGAGVTLPLLVVRIRHRSTDHFPAGHDEDGKPLFSMGLVRHRGDLPGVIHIPHTHVAVDEA
ncbi:amino acid permease [Cryptosporangium sp. NPDC048952]|uniref:amino acid permease n=1 Tax=Cryptosporangium sp. NPDC048952 TaxID=3363961 RepID=UPI003714F306